MALALSTLQLAARRHLERSDKRDVQIATALSKCLLIVVLSMATGCDSSEKLPLTGNVSLQFVRSSPSGMHFRLANQSNEPVSFRGTTEKGDGASPWDTLLECKPPGSDVWQEGPFALVDGGPATVAVPSGDQVDLVVGDKLAEQYKGGLCRLSLRLESGSFIKSNEFEP
jgi:hypothetical protein